MLSFLKLAHNPQQERSTMTAPTTPEATMINLDVLGEYPTAHLQAAYKRIDAELERRKSAERIKNKLLKMAQQAGVKITIEEGDGQFLGELVRYKNPANALETWTGRGRKPNWLTQALASGKKLEDYEVNESPLKESPKGASLSLKPDFAKEPHKELYSKS